MSKKCLRVAVAGNPNCGKTTLFNELTGSRQMVGNWPGVTVDRTRLRAATPHNPPATAIKPPSHTIHINGNM